MKTITKKEFTDWIKAQPDDRPVNMGDSDGQGCGCLMWQYAKELFPDEEGMLAGITMVSKAAQGVILEIKDFQLGDIFKFNGDSPCFFLSDQWKTFGELRTIMCI